MSSDRDNQVEATSTVTADRKVFASSDYNAEEFEAYRALSKAAVVSAGFSIIGLLGFVFVQLWLVAAVGSIFAFIAFVNLRRYRNELTGTKMSLLGAVV